MKEMSLPRSGQINGKHLASINFVFSGEHNFLCAVQDATSSTGDRNIRQLHPATVE